MNRYGALFVLAACACCSISVQAGDWSQFRGPDGRAAAPDSRIPLTWSAETNVVWRVAIPGHGASTPITFGDQIFLTYFDGYGLDPDAPGDKSKLRLHVMSLSLQDGSTLWDESIAAAASEQSMNRRVADHGYATPTPACDGTGVYAYFGVSGVVAYDLAGRPKWQLQVGDKTAGFGTAASVSLYRDLVLVNASIEGNALYAIEKESGTVRWKAENIERSWMTPLVVRTPGGRDEVVINQKNQVLGFDAETGERLWWCDAVEDYIVPCAVAHEGIVYCIGGRSNRALAVRTGGRGDVTETHRLWRVNVGANVTSPILLDGHLYWASDKGIAYCLDAATGEIVYRERIPTRARIYASMVHAGDYLYVTTRDSGVLVYPARPEFQQLAQNVIDGDENLFNASPAVVGNALLLRNNEYLYAIGRVEQHVE